MSGARIVLFADAGAGIGTGHIFRLYPIFRRLMATGVAAEMWVPLGAEPLARLGAIGVKPAPIEPEAIVSTLSRSRPDVVALDTYRHLPVLFEAFGSLDCHVAIFDDHFRVNRNVALIVNSSPAVSASDYDRGLAAEFLLGPTYASVNPAFEEARRGYAVSENISRVLLALGGEDFRGNLPALIGALVPLLPPAVEICVLSARPIPIDVPGSVKLNWDWLDQDSLAQRMPKFDLAILAGGTMLWQTACVGIPTISWPQTSGQEGHAAAWEDRGAVIVIKELATLPAAFKRIQSHRLRHELSSACRKLVDGVGASRVADRLCSLLKE